MSRTSVRAAAACLAVASALVAAPEAPARECAAPEAVALGGLDPVALIGGAETQGSPAIEAAHGPYHYHFASAENRAAFERSPERWSIRLGGACARMGPLSGMGDPRRHLVHDGKLYVFASDACRRRFAADPSRFLESDDAVPQGSEEERLRGARLVDRAVAAVGGAERLDAISTLQVRLSMTWIEGGKTYEGRRILTFGFPAGYRTEESWESAGDVLVATPSGAYRSGGGRSFAAGDEVRAALGREALREPIAILRARREPGFTAVAAGRERVGGREADVVKVGVRGATSSLWIDAETGRILRIAHPGLAADGIGEVAREFSDFRDVQGLTLPFGVRSFSGGQPLERPATAVDAIRIDPPGAAELFKPPA